MLDHRTAGAGMRKTTRDQQSSFEQRGSTVYSATETIVKGHPT